MINFKTSGRITLGLTGAVSSGKSAAAARFKKCGALVINADELAAKHFALNAEKIKKYFGTDDKKQIAACVFKNPASRKWLESLLHPAAIKEAKQIIKNAGQKIIVFDAPLLFEAGLGNSFDLTICIYAAYDIRLCRAAFAVADFKARDGAQLPLDFKAANADIVIYNEGAKKDLEAKISKVYKAIK